MEGDMKRVWHIEADVALHVKNEITGKKTY